MTPYMLPADQSRLRFGDVLAVSREYENDTRWMFVGVDLQPGLYKGDGMFVVVSAHSAPMGPVIHFSHEQMAGFVVLREREEVFE